MPSRHKPLTSMFDFAVLRELRKRNRLTIADVSSRSGISAAVISKLERNRTTAELETLFKLARVFGLSATDLLALAESRTAHRKQATATHDAGGFHFEEIDYNNCRCLYGTAPAGARLSRPEMHGDDYEICWVRRGAVTFQLPDERHELNAGEAIQFDAILEHQYEAARDCEVVILHLRKGKRF